MKPLSFEELKNALENKQFVAFHPDYEHQAWKDGKVGPLSLIDVCILRGDCYVSYKCVDEQCYRCSSSSVNPDLRIHHQIIKEDGFHVFDKVEYIETKKTTTTKFRPNPVFVLYKE